MTTLLAAELMVAGTTFVLKTAGEYKMLEKMGEKGWKALVPFLGDYTFFKKVWNKKMFWTSMAAGAAAIATASVLDAGLAGSAVTTGCLAATSIAACGVAAVLNLKLLHKVSKAFGHGLGYTAGLAFFPEIFNMVLGFGKSEFAAA